MNTSIFLISMLLFSVVCSSFAIKSAYVVYLGVHRDGCGGGDPTEVHCLVEVTESHYDFLGTILGSKKKAKDAIFYSYTRHINGFAAMLEDSEATRISEQPGVLSVFPNRGKKLHTTWSWNFLGLEKNGRIGHRSIWMKARFGSETIIANLDTGVWPESKSFRDEHMEKIPEKWRGICQNDFDATFQCNRKLIGARYFNKGYVAAGGRLDSSFSSPRDVEGHGTHTLSTAGGNFVSGASIFGYGEGTAKGGSPRARVATYKVCWPPVGGFECYDADILAAFDMAIHDGVDVISVSLGGEPSPFLNDGLAIGSFHAVRRGIVVVCSAGNSGPSAGTVSNVAPWQITVAASTIDRQFRSYVVLGSTMSIQGESLSVEALPKQFFPLVSAASAKATNASVEEANLCKSGSLDPRKVKGKILVCLRGENPRVDKGEQALLAGAVGMILANDEASGNEIIADPHFLPASQINYTDGLALYSYIKNTKSPRAYISRPQTKLMTKPAPLMAAFSSMGPNIIMPELLKPDITAPGVSIIAAYTEAQGPTDEDFDKRRVKFNSVSGTSMSCPHISGIVGLIKTLHPHWSPAAIRSAIMTTSRSRDNTVEAIEILNASYVKATPFSYGAGHVNPKRAMDPGLVYDLNDKDYLSFICSLGYTDNQIKLFTEGNYKCPKTISLINFNYPSIAVPCLKRSVTVTRTLKNVGDSGTYKAQIVPPAGVSAKIEPKTIRFESVGEEKSFKLTLESKNKNAGTDYVFGRLTWYDGKHHVRSPIVVKGC